MPKTHQLITVTMGSFGPSGNPIANIQPVNYMPWGAWSRQVTYAMRIAAIETTAPAWALLARVEYCIESTEGYQYENPVWAPLDAVGVATDIVEGVGIYAGSHPAPVGADWGLIADQTDLLPTYSGGAITTPAGTAPLFFKRTVRNTTLRNRIAFKWVIPDGGPNPALRVDLAATPLR